MDITLLIRLAISFLKTAIKNPDSKKARRIVKYVRELNELTTEYLEEFDGDQK